MGVSSANIEMLPKLSSRLGCLQSLISFSPARVKRGVVIIEVSYPFNFVTYDAVLHLIKQRHFKFTVSLVGPRDVGHLCPHD